MALLSWIFLIGPTVRGSGALLPRLTAAAYPLGDVLVLAMLAHLWSAGGLRNPAGRLLAIGPVITNLLADPTVEGTVVTMRDVSEQNGLEEELKHQAFHDALTGLPNRALFRDRLDQALARSARHGAPLAVLFLDLEDFKLVNDSRGDSAGDDLLVAVARRLSSTLRSGDTAARANRGAVSCR